MCEVDEMLRIGEFSKLSRVSIRMLRHYDDLELLTPEYIDEFTGYRYYSEMQLSRVNRITALKDMGFSLGVIKQILSQYNDKEALQEFLALREAEVREQLVRTQEQLRLLETTINRLGKDDLVMKYNVTLKEIPEMTVASVRKVIPTYEAEGMLWQILMTETAGLNLQDTDPCYTMAIFHDQEYKETNVDVEVQKSFKGDFTNTENVTFKKVAPIQVASAICKGSYDQMNEVNEAVAHWVQDNGYDFNGPAFNIYHVSPHETQNPDEYVTEVCYPVIRK